MKTTLDIIDILWQHLTNSSLPITGSIYKQQRPASTKEDIVIGSLPVNNEQLQTAVANVNIYVPNLHVSTNGVQQSLPNFARLKTLATAALEVLNEKWTTDYHFAFQQQTIFDDGDAHYINIRIDFYSLQTN